MLKCIPTGHPIAVKRQKELYKRQLEEKESQLKEKFIVPCFRCPIKEEDLRTFI